MSSNQYNITISPQPDPARSNVYLLQRPTFVSYQSMNFSFNLLAGQPLRLRETIQFAAKQIAPFNSYRWNNRPFDEAYMGHYVVTKQLESGSAFGNISQKIIGKREPVNDDIFSFAYSIDREINLYPRLNDRPTFGSIIFGCNAEIRPAAVSNTEITPQNALEYAKILFLLGKKQLGQAASAINELSKPVTAGYRFPDGVIFRGDNQTQIVGLSQGQIATGIGDLWIKLEPDWELLQQVDYDIRAIDFGLIDPTPISFQFPETIQCLAPEDEAKLPISNQCYVDFQSFLLTEQDAYPSLAQATAGRFLKGIDADTRWAIDDKEWLCPNDNADVYSYWKLRLKAVGGCQDEFANILGSLQAGVGRGNSQALAIADFRARNPGFTGTDLQIQSGINNFPCSNDPSQVLVIWTAISSIVNF